jgi:hypothetical protein
MTRQLLRSLCQLVGKLARLVLPDPEPDHVARQTVPARQFMLAGASLEELARDLALKLRTEARCRPLSYHPTIALAWSNPKNFTCPVFGVQSTERNIFDPLHQQT